MRATLAPLIVFLGGCMAYTPVAATPQIQNEPVRLRLNQDGSAALAPLLGAATSEVRGRVQSVSDSSIVLLVSEVARADGGTEPWNGERAEIPLRDVTSVAKQRTSVARSALLGGLLAGGVYLVGHSFGGGNATGSHTTGGGSAQ